MSPRVACLGCLGILLGVAIGVIGLVWSVPASEADFTVRLTGSPGVAYVGSYSATRRTGHIQQIDIHGEVPASYQVRAASLRVRVLRQPGNQGSLNLEIVRDSVAVARDQTSIPDGVVEATADLLRPSPPRDR